jgi:GntR family transcriptional regulator
MEIKVDFQLGVPIYEQIAHQILSLIDEGKLPSGTQLPTIRALAVELGVNFNTVARAYRKLDQEGIISTQQGRGTFILEREGKPEDRGSKGNNIRELTRFYLRKADYLGFTPEEIKRCLEEIIQENKS